MAKKVVITKIDPSDILAKSNITINDNFESLEKTVNELDNILTSSDRKDNYYPDEVIWKNGDLKNGPTGIIKMKNTSSVAKINSIPAADKHISGIITAIKQIISGEKSFEDGIKLSGDFSYIKGTNEKYIIRQTNNRVYIGTNGLKNEGLIIEYDEKGNYKDIYYNGSRLGDVFYENFEVLTQSLKKYVDQYETETNKKLASYDEKFGELSSQIDSEVNHWFGKVEITESNTYSHLNEIDNGVFVENEQHYMPWMYDRDPVWDEPKFHINDTYTYIDDLKSTKSYSYEETSTGFYWEEITDEEILGMLQAASKNFSSNDGKTTTFRGKPTPPYEIGDVWVVQETDLNIIHSKHELESIKNGEYLYCINNKQYNEKFDISDWDKSISLKNVENILNDRLNEFGNKLNEQIDKSIAMWTGIGAPDVCAGTQNLLYTPWMSDKDTNNDDNDNHIGDTYTDIGEPLTEAQRKEYDNDDNDKFELSLEFKKTNNSKTSGFKWEFVKGADGNGYKWITADKDIMDEINRQIGELGIGGLADGIRDIFYGTYLEVSGKEEKNGVLSESDPSKVRKHKYGDIWFCTGYLEKDKSGGENPKWGAGNIYVCINGSDNDDDFHGWHDDDWTLLTDYNTVKEMANEAAKAADESSKNATDAVNKISAMNDDGIFDITEKLTIRKEWSEISGVNNLTSDAADTGSYKKTKKFLSDSKLSSLDTKNLDKTFGDLKNFLNDAELYENKNFPEDKKSNYPNNTSLNYDKDNKTYTFNRQKLLEVFREYYNAEQDLLNEINKSYTDKKITDAQLALTPDQIEEIKKQLDNEATNYFKKDPGYPISTSSPYSEWGIPAQGTTTTDDRVKKIEEILSNHVYDTYTSLTYKNNDLNLSWEFKKIGIHKSIYDKNNIENIDNTIVIERYGALFYLYEDISLLLKSNNIIPEEIPEKLVFNQYLYYINGESNSVDKLFLSLCDYGNENLYGWVKIITPDKLQILANTSGLQSAIDGKVTTFTSKPNNYKRGDMWVVGDDYQPKINNVTIKENELLIATEDEDNTVYKDGDWKPLRYSEDLNTITNTINTIYAIPEGKSVKTVDTYYLINDGDKPTNIKNITTSDYSKWNSNVPDKDILKGNTGKYLWSTTIISYTDGTSNIDNAVNNAISTYIPKDGDSSSSGNFITEIQEIYYKVQKEQFSTTNITIPEEKITNTDSKKYKQWWTAKSSTYDAGDSVWSATQFIDNTRTLIKTTTPVCVSGMVSTTSIDGLGVIDEVVTSGSTESQGGLSLTNILCVKDLNDRVTGGLSGVTTVKKTDEGQATGQINDNVGLFLGSDYETAFASANWNQLTDDIKFKYNYTKPNVPVLLTKTGTGSNIGGCYFDEDTSKLMVPVSNIDGEITASKLTVDKDVSNTDDAEAVVDSNSFMIKIGRSYIKMWIENGIPSIVGVDAEGNTRFSLGGYIDNIVKIIPEEIGGDIYLSGDDSSSDEDSSSYNNSFVKCKLPSFKLLKIKDDINEIKIEKIIYKYKIGNQYGYYDFEIEQNYKNSFKKFDENSDSDNTYNVEKINYIIDNGDGSITYNNNTVTINDESKTKIKTMYSIKSKNSGNYIIDNNNPYIFSPNDIKADTKNVTCKEFGKYGITEPFVFEDTNNNNIAYSGTPSLLNNGNIIKYDTFDENNDYIMPKDGVVRPNASKVLHRVFYSLLRPYFGQIECHGNGVDGVGHNYLYGAENPNSVTSVYDEDKNSVITVYDNTEYNENNRLSLYSPNTYSKLIAIDPPTKWDDSPMHDTILNLIYNKTANYHYPFIMDASVELTINGKKNNNVDFIQQTLSYNWKDEPFKIYPKDKDKDKDYDYKDYYVYKSDIKIISLRILSFDYIQVNYTKDKDDAYLNYIKTELEKSIKDIEKANINIFDLTQEETVDKNETHTTALCPIFNIYISYEEKGEIKSKRMIIYHNTYRYIYENNEFAGLFEIFNENKEGEGLGLNVSAQITFKYDNSFVNNITNKDFDDISDFKDCGFIYTYYNGINNEVYKIDKSFNVELNVKVGNLSTSSKCYINVVNGLVNE